MYPIDAKCSGFKVEPLRMPVDGTQLLVHLCDYINNSPHASTWDCRKQFDLKWWIAAHFCTREGRALSWVFQGIWISHTRLLSTGRSEWLGGGYLHIEYQSRRAQRATKVLECAQNKKVLSENISRRPIQIDDFSWWKLRMPYLCRAQQVDCRLNREASGEVWACEPWDRSMRGDRDEDNYDNNYKSKRACVTSLSDSHQRKPCSVGQSQTQKQEIRSSPLSLRILDR